MNRDAHIARLICLRKFQNRIDEFGRSALISLFVLQFRDRSERLAVLRNRDGDPAGGVNARALVAESVNFDA